MRNASTNALLQPIKGLPLGIGAGGMCTKLSVASDDTILMGCDTAPPWSLAPGATQWVREFQAGSTIAISDLDVLYQSDGTTPHPGGDIHTYDVEVAWSNSAVRYALVMGYVWVKKPGASTYTKTNFAHQVGGYQTNYGYRGSGKMLRCDPANPAVIWFAGAFGVSYSTDYGDTITSVSTSTLPLPTGGGLPCIDFWRQGTVTSGRTQSMCIFLPGQGLYTSSNAGSTWTKTATNKTTNPTAANKCAFLSNGRIMCIGMGGEVDTVPSVWNGSAWSEPANGAGRTFAEDSQTAGQVYLIGVGGNVSVSSDYGTTVQAGAPNPTVTSADVGYHLQVENYKTACDAAFLPSSRTMFLAGGIGAFKFVNPPTSIPDNTTVVNCTGLSKGIENMVTAQIVISPDGTRGIAMHDRGLMISDRDKMGVAFPARYGPNATNLDHGCTIDYSPDNQAIWYGTHAASNGDEHYGFSNDRGVNWTVRNNLVAQTSGGGIGQICVLGNDVVLAAQQSAYAPSSATRTKNAVYLSMNARATIPTWTEVLIGNGNSIVAQTSRLHARRVLVKDRTTTGNIRTAYFFNCGNVDNPTSTDNVACVGLWQIDVNMTTGATTVTRLTSANIMDSNRDLYHGKLTVVGYRDLLWAGGDAAIYGLKRYKGGSSWTELTGTDDQGAGTMFAEVFCAAVGKNAYGSSYPTIYALGIRANSQTPRSNASVANGYGLWRSEDDGLTWKLCMRFPDGVFDHPFDMAADPQVFGAVDIAFSGTGVMPVRDPFVLNAS